MNWEDLGSTASKNKENKQKVYNNTQKSQFCIYG